MLFVFMFLFFFFNDTATTEIYTLSLHDALPISPDPAHRTPPSSSRCSPRCSSRDRKSTPLNSSHVRISYAVFCLKKKKNTNSSPGSTSDQVLKKLVSAAAVVTSTFSVGAPGYNCATRPGSFSFLKDCGPPKIYPLSLNRALPS